MNELKKVPLNTDRILKLAEEAFADSTGANDSEDDEDRYSSHYIEEENQGSTAPADEPAQAPASTPEPEHQPRETVKEDPYRDFYREAMETNKQLLSMLHEQNQRQFSSTRTTEPGSERAHQGSQPADPYSQFEPEHLVMHQDLAPLHSTLREVQTVTNMFVSRTQREVESEAFTAFEQIKQEFPDAPELINQQLFQAAVNGAKLQAVQALKQGREFKVDWRAQLLDEYNKNDAPRLRERMRAEQAKAQAEAEAKAKQQAELDKVSGVPSRGAQYQPASNGNPRKVEPGGDWKSTLRSRVNSVVTRFKAE